MNLDLIDIEVKEVFEIESMENKKECFQDEKNDIFIRAIDEN